MNKLPYKVVSLHFTDICNLKCSFCYKKHTKPLYNKVKKSHKFFIESIPYIKELAPQCAVGGGEPLMFPLFIRRFASDCKRHGVLCNVTTNGKIILTMKDELLKLYTQDITMISVSYDTEKYTDLSEYKDVINKLRYNYKGQIGCNLLLTDDMFYVNSEENPLKLIQMITLLFNDIKVHRVYLLYPKNIRLNVDITRYKDLFMALSFKYKRLFVDDLFKEILSQGYEKWSKPCHYGKDIISINEYGYVTGCSFDNCSEGFYLDKPKDLLLLKHKKWDKRMMCPYLVR